MDQGGGDARIDTARDAAQDAPGESAPEDTVLVEITSLPVALVVETRPRSFAAS